MAPLLGRVVVGVWVQAPTGQQKARSPKMELSDIAQDKPALSFFSSFFLFFSSLVCSGIHFLVFNFILKFIFTANVHVGIMVNICYFYCYYCFL